MLPSSSPPPSSSPTRPTADIELARTKRQLAATQAKLDSAVGQKRKRKSDSNIGRGVCRLVSLFDSVQTIVEAEDNHFLAGSEDGDEEDEDPEDTKRRQERRHAAFLLLLRHVPQVKKLIEDPDLASELDILLGNVHTGAMGGRRDDLRCICIELSNWLNLHYAPQPPFLPKDRSDRGLGNDITGEYLCPLTADWDKPSDRAEIRAGTLNISADYFLRAFYPKQQGNPKDLEAGFLRSTFLVKTYCAIFTSPSSADSFTEDGDDGPARKKQKTDGGKKVTKSNVAQLLGMDGKVTPQSIAYAAVMLAFNLTDCRHWQTSYNGFSYEGLYNFIVDFFEDVQDPVTKKKTDDLLKWWNRQVFPDHVTSEQVSRASTNTLKEQRARRAAATAAA